MSLTGLRAAPARIRAAIPEVPTAVRNRVNEMTPGGAALGGLAFGAVGVGGAFLGGRALRNWVRRAGHSSLRRRYDRATRNAESAFQKQLQAWEKFDRGSRLPGSGPIPERPVFPKTSSPYLVPALGAAYGVGTGLERNRHKPSWAISPVDDALRSGAFVGGGSALLTYLMNRSNPGALGRAAQFGGVLGAGVGAGAGTAALVAKARSRARESMAR